MNREFHLKRFAITATASFRNAAMREQAGMVSKAALGRIILA